MLHKRVENVLCPVLVGFPLLKAEPPWVFYFLQVLKTCGGVCIKLYGKLLLDILKAHLFKDLVLHVFTTPICLALVSLK
jgi:hypothetical protein